MNRIRCNLAMAFAGLFAAFGIAEDDQNVGGPSTLDRQLFEDLDVPSSTSHEPSARDRQPEDRSATNDPIDARLQRIYENMLESRTRLMGFDVDDETVRRQAQIVTDLENLLRARRQTAKGHPPADNSAGQSGSQPADRAPSAVSGNLIDTPSTSTDQRPEALMQQVWGHLPPNVRPSLQASGEEQFLPKYRKEIEAYYRALSRQPSRRLHPSRIELNPTERGTQR